MSMTEKETLANDLAVELSDKFNIKAKEAKYVITTVLERYHVTISDEAYHGEDLSTSYLMKKFIEGKTAVGMSENTLKQYNIAVMLLEKITGKQLADVEPEDIQRFMLEYKKQCNVSAVTVKMKYQLLSSVYNWLYIRKYIMANPIAAVDSPKCELKVKKPLSDYDLEKIKRACESLDTRESLRDMALVHFFISTGCRVSEVKNIKIGDIDFEKKNCKVMGKGKKERFVILTDRAMYRLKLYIDSKWNKDKDQALFTSIRGGYEHELTKDGIENIISKIRQLAGVENLTCHVFRRYYATELRKRNVSIQMIAASLGHANLNQINRYSLYSSTEMQDTIRKAM